MKPLRLILLTVFALLLSAAPASAVTVLEAGTALQNSRRQLCGNGFNLRGYLLLRPGCASTSALDNTIFNSSGSPVGVVTATSSTATLVRVTASTQVVQRPTIAGTQITITGSAEAPVGAQVCAFGRTTGVKCGTVVAKNQTVNWSEGVLHGLTRTSICVQPGDSWSPVYSGTQAQGHMIGGSGCTSYFLPIRPALDAYGQVLLTG